MRVLTVAVAIPTISATYLTDSQWK